MALFNFKNKKVKVKASACDCDCTELKTAQAENGNSQKSSNDIYCIKVLGSGCKNCHTLFENTKNAVASIGLSVEVEYVTDMQKIMGYGVMSMPALVINEKVASMGKVLKAGDVERLLKKYLNS